MNERMKNEIRAIQTLPHHPQMELMIDILTGETNVSSAGFPYISDASFHAFIQHIPHLFQHGQRTLEWLRAVNDRIGSTALAANEIESAQRAISVLRTVTFTAGVTAPPDLWLLKQVLSTHRKLGTLDALDSATGVAPDEYADEHGFSRKQLTSDLNFLYSRGYLKKMDSRFALASDAPVRRVVESISILDPQYRIDMVPVLMDWFKQRSPRRESFVENWFSIDAAEQPTGSWIASRLHIELGYRLVPLILSWRVCGFTGLLKEGNRIEQHVPGVVPGIVNVLELAGIIENQVVTELGARIFERAPGPFGIIAAYHTYMNNLEGLIHADRSHVHVQRGANVAASQDANRKSFEEANDRLDAFCRESGFRYSVFIEHAVGRGEATRQRLERSGEKDIRYFGADLEDAAIDQAVEQQRKRLLPQNMEFIRSADIGDPQRVTEFLTERGLDGKPTVMIVGNGFHEIRNQTNERMLDVFRAYQNAGFILLFTEESALENDDLLNTAWNTYHAGFRYVHELSGQGLRPAVDRDGESGRWSWRRCAKEAGYVVLERFSYKSRSIYPYKRPARENPSISETYFCVPRKVAHALGLRDAA
jgi:hypothetical protein